MTEHQSIKEAVQMFCKIIETYVCHLKHEIDKDEYELAGSTIAAMEKALEKLITNFKKIAKEHA